MADTLRERIEEISDHFEKDMGWNGVSLRLREALEETAPVSEADKIAREICDSESFMWLMVGSNHTESQLAALRDAWSAYTAAGGGYGNRARGKGLWS